MLLGEYEHTLDIKGRLAMPAKLREALGNKFIITKGLDGCLFVYDMEEWHKVEAKLAACSQQSQILKLQLQSKTIPAYKTVSFVHKFFHLRLESF